MLNYGRSKKFNSTNSIGSLATSAATDRAQATALGNNRGQVGSELNMSPQSRRPRRLHKGSAAGLKNEKSVRLSVNNSGYENPSNQTARNKRKQKTPTIAPKISGIMRGNAKTINNDMRMSSDKNSSVSKLDRRIGKG